MDPFKDARIHEVIGYLDGYIDYLTADVEQHMKNFNIFDKKQLRKHSETIRKLYQQIGRVVCLESELLNEQSKFLEEQNTKSNIETKAGEWSVKTIPTQSK